MNSPFSSRSLSWFLGSLSQCPPYTYPKDQQGLTHSQNSRMERISGNLCHRPSFYEKWKPRESM